MRLFLILVALGLAGFVAWAARDYFAAPSAYADGSIGQVARVDVQAQHCADAGPICTDAVPAMGFSQGARLVTDKAGRLRATLIDDTLITLGPDTDIVIDQFVYRPGTLGTFITSLSRGAFRLVSGGAGKAPDSDVMVETPVASIGVRGTDFAVRQTDTSLDVVLIEGRVDVSNAFGAVTLSAMGDYAVILDDQSPPLLRTGLSRGQIVELLSATAFDEELAGLADPTSDFRITE